MKLSIIIPARNESAEIAPLLHALLPIRNLGHEVIVVDGGSQDDTITIAQPLVDQLVESPVGRARQMNAGAAVAGGDVLWFLHADCVIPQGAVELISGAIPGNSPAWGRFDVRLSGEHKLLRVVERMMNWRSCMTGIATGDQGIFVSRVLFDQVGGYPDQQLMEDIEISKQLKQRQSPVCLHEKLVTSSRRWEQHGIIQTIIRMWFLRLAYYLGVPASKLVLHYD